jgi:CBS-domain-containing membrane protein
MPTVTAAEPLSTLISILAKWYWQVPVIDKAQKLQGVVINTGVFAALAKK